MVMIRGWAVKDLPGVRYTSSVAFSIPRVSRTVSSAVRSMCKASEVIRVPQFKALREVLRVLRRPFKVERQKYVTSS